MVMVGHRRPEVEVRSIDWVDDQVVLLDQTRLPREERWLAVTTVDEPVDAIRRLAVRGAPLLGAAGALGGLLAVHEAEQEGWDALRVLAEDRDVNRAIGATGARLLIDLVDIDRLRIYTHCNAGALACVEWGTALGVVHSLSTLDRLGSVYVGETR